MTILNSRIAHLKPSATLKVKTLATELKAQGRTIVDLSAGEPDIDTPEHIKEAANQALRDGCTKYTPVPGEKPLRERIAQKLTEENGIETSFDEVIVTNGGKQALHEIFQVSLEPGDEVIITAPYWVSYPPMVEIAGGKPVIVESSYNNSYKLTPAQLEEAMSEATKFVVINSPSNPTGAGYSRDELRALGEVIAKYDAYVVSDEVYEKITYGDYEFVSFAAAVPELKDRTVTVNAFSKTYSMTGWRLGYAAGPKELIGGMSKFQSQTTSNVCAAAQRAGIAALDGPHDFLTGLVGDYMTRMKAALGYVEEIPGLSVATMPEGAFYLFVRINELVTQSQGLKFSGSVDFSEFLLDKAGVAVVPGAAFGDDMAVRVSVSSSLENIENGFECIKRALSEVTLG